MPEALSVKPEPYQHHWTPGARYNEIYTGWAYPPKDYATGSPVFTNDHVRMGIANQLRNLDSAFKIIASFPELPNKPIVVGESDPDGCAGCQGDQLGYRNGSIYASYTAASIAREFQLADRQGVNLEGALTWAFEFEGQPLFAGFRVLASGGVDLPVLNVFRMLSQMGRQRLAVESDGAVPLDDMLQGGVRARPDVRALASRDKNRLCILAWHYHDDDLSGADAEVGLTVVGLPPDVREAHCEQFRVDAAQSNAFTAWKAWVRRCNRPRNNSRSLRRPASSRNWTRRKISPSPTATPFCR